MIFNLPDYHVIDAVDLPSGGRRVIVQADTVADGCPDCGVVSARVRAWCRQRVKDIPHAGSIEVIVVKPRLVCAEGACSRRTFTQATAELPVRARCTSRLRRGLLEAVIDHGRPVAAVAASFGVAWWTAQKTVNSAIDTLPDTDALHVTQLGVDEHRYRKVRWYRDPDTGGWSRVEPWMTTIVNTRCGQVLGVVDGRHSAAVEGWLTARSQVWRDRVTVVAIDPSGPLKVWLTSGFMPPV
ncbi:MAG: transposase [Propionibacteriaceae bacterium]|nr:transposase [Propionibacteriaceae bacterium]